MLLKLPVEILSALIFSYMGVRDLCALRGTCHYFRAASKSYIEAFVKIKLAFKSNKQAAEQEYFIQLEKPMLYIEQNALAVANLDI